MTMKNYHTERRERLAARVECIDCHTMVLATKAINLLIDGHIRVICHLPCYMKRIGYWREPTRLIDMIDPYQAHEENDDGE